MPILRANPLMCDDLNKAKANRERIKNKENTEFWVRLEQWLREHPNKATPIPPEFLGKMPQIVEARE